MSSLSDTSAAAARERASVILKRYDNNRDGSLSDEEISKILSDYDDPTLREQLPLEIREALQFYDQNKNSKLDREEMSALKLEVELHKARMAGYGAAIATTARYLVSLK